MPEHRQLAIPPETQKAERAQEILRVWINADKSMHSSINPAFYETGAWGILLVDLTHQIADAYAQATQLSKDEVIRSIHAVYTSGFSSRSDLLTNAKGEPVDQGKKKK